jgi:hypothetical protein
MPPKQGCCKGGPRPFTPEDPRNLAIPFCRNGSTGVEFGTVENLLILDSHFRGCIQLQESRLPVVCKVPCVHFFHLVLHGGAGRFGTLKRQRSMIPA